MRTVAGVFSSFESARNGVEALVRAGIPRDRVNLFSPGPTAKDIHAVPTSETEPPGVGGAIGAVLGGTLGIAGGFELSGLATALVPGVGPVIAIGLAATALLGAAGAVGGAALGGAADKNTTDGVPSDEIFFYEDALRQGRSVVLVLGLSDSERKRAELALAQAGAESLDAARQDWWLGLRSVEEEHYRAAGHNFEADQEVYRAGFESALRRECRGKSADEQSDCLKWWYPDTWDSEPFRRGYRRGQEYWERESLVGHGPRFGDPGR
jgi:hypothetical protein